MDSKAVKEWITIIGIGIAVIATVIGAITSLATKTEMNRRFDEARDERTRIESHALHHRNRIEDKLERLNQNYINHLAQHNKGD